MACETGGRGWSDVVFVGFFEGVREIGSSWKLEELNTADNEQQCFTFKCSGYQKVIIKKETTANSSMI